MVNMAHYRNNGLSDRFGVLCIFLWHRQTKRPVKALLLQEIYHKILYFQSLFTPSPQAIDPVVEIPIGLAALRAIGIFTTGLTTWRYLVYNDR